MPNKKGNAMQQKPKVNTKRFEAADYECVVYVEYGATGEDGQSETVIHIVYVMDNATAAVKLGYEDTDDGYAVVAGVMDDLTDEYVSAIFRENIAPCFSKS